MPSSWIHKLSVSCLLKDHKFLSSGIAVLCSCRNDICYDLDDSCSDQGSAFPGGMCVPDQACAIIQDDGLRLGYVVAHEIGHTYEFSSTENVGFEPN